ncbi:MAG TPA: transposase [Candidatus Saccharimonadia bacterium]|nr:transposase [Candidatus Saccharimonadia bacterium]
MVVKDEHDRIFMTHETASENGEDAKKFLQHVKDLGFNVTAAFLADSQSFTEAIKAVWPQARFQADHFHTVKNIGGHLKKSLLSYRRKIKAHGEANNDAQVMERAKTLWKFRWSLLKKPAHVSGEEKQALAELGREDAGFVQSFRHIIIRQLVHIFDHTHSETQARMKLQ